MARLWRRRAASLLALCVMVPASGPAGADIACRNVKSAAQCALEERDATVSRDRERERTPAKDAVAMEKITVSAERESASPAPEQTRWDRFARTLTVRPVYVEMPANDGGRIACVTEPPVCKVNCCIRSRGFSLAGPRVGQPGQH